MLPLLLGSLFVFACLVWSKLRLLLASLALTGIVLGGLVLLYVCLRLLRHQMQWVTSLLVGRMLRQAQRAPRGCHQLFRAKRERAKARR